MIAFRFQVFSKKYKKILFYWMIAFRFQVFSKKYKKNLVLFIFSKNKTSYDAISPFVLLSGRSLNVPNQQLSGISY